eukprot:scaffold273034_cov28-Tisochrysis_lutea.AAC.4
MVQLEGQLSQYQYQLDLYVVHTGEAPRAPPPSGSNYSVFYVTYYVRRGHTRHADSDPPWVQVLVRRLSSRNSKI